MNPKSVRNNYIHPWVCLRNFVPIAQYLREVMARRTHSPWTGRRKIEVGIIFWRAMFGVKYLENPWREKLNFFSKKLSGFIFWRVEKWVSWLESVRSKKNRERPKSWEHRSDSNEDIAMHSNIFNNKSVIFWIDASWIINAAECIRYTYTECRICAM